MVRNNLENAKVREEDRIQKATASANTQIKTLQDTVSELREELEKDLLKKKRQYKMLYQFQIMKSINLKCLCLLQEKSLKKQN